MTDSVRIERTFNAPVEKVWSAWTDPALLARWYCPNPDLSVRADVDLRPEGAWMVDMGGRYVARGQYTTIEEPALLEFTWAWDHEPDVPVSTVRVELEEVDGGTRLVLTHADLADADEAKGHGEGWDLSLGRLAGLLAE